MTHDKIPESPHHGHPARDHNVDRGGQEACRAKYDLGYGNGVLPTENIPWSYGECRITSMARDPDWLYVYWEVSDEAIEKARGELSDDGQDAGCCLRVYDTTSKEFDGFDANSYFDVAIERTSRDGFIHVGKPSSSCHVDVGLKSIQGEFRPIARSGRTDFPRKRPAEDSSVEWLTVQSVNEESLPVCTPYESKFDGPVPTIETYVEPTPPPKTQHQSVVHWLLQPTQRFEVWRKVRTERRSFSWSTRVSHRFENAEHRWSVPWLSEPWRTEWQGEERAFTWVHPLHQLMGFERMTSTEFSGASAHHLEGGRIVFRFIEDQTRDFTQTGYWEVVIHRLAMGTFQRRVLGTWLLTFFQPEESSWSRWELKVQRHRFDGFLHEHVMLGASENQAMLESGASESWLLEASEQMLLGASERLALGGSEELWLGASEKRWGGASETSWALEWLGASEQQWARENVWSIEWLGASEHMAETASAMMERGASEHLAFVSSHDSFAGASESWLHETAFSETSSESFFERFASEQRLGSSEILHEQSLPFDFPGTLEPTMTSARTLSPSSDDGESGKEGG